MAIADETDVSKVFNKANLEAITEAQFNSFNYVAYASFLVHVTAVFDSFLSDVAAFLVAINPASVKDSFSAGYDYIFSSGGIEGLKTELLYRKIRAISFQSFRDRLKFIKKHLVAH